MAAKNTFSQYFLLQISFFVYSFIALASKLASGQTFFSSEFFLFTGLVFVLLVLYAFIWQKALKVFPLTKAYANKAVVVVWNLLWASLILGERITLENLVGSAIIIVGIVLVSSDGS